jgi:hypothetical protein
VDEGFSEAIQSNVMSPFQVDDVRKRLKKMRSGLKPNNGIVEIKGLIRESEVKSSGTNR